MKKRWIWVLACIIILLIAGAGISEFFLGKELQTEDVFAEKLEAETAIERGADTEKLNSISQKMECTEKIYEEAEWEEPAVPLVIAADFDEKFEIKEGETLYIGREDICLTLDYVSREEDSISYGYTLRMGTKIYYAHGIWKESIGENTNQDVWTEKRVRFFAADEAGTSATMMLTETTEIKKPMVLSGNSADVYMLTQPEYVETDKFILFMDKGTKVYGDTVELLETIFMLAEKESGLSPDKEPCYAFIPNDGPRWYFGSETFAGVDPEVKKYHVYVVPFEKSAPCGGYGFLCINPMDLEIAKGDAYPIVHEYTHSLHVANGPWLNRILTEGLTTYTTGQIADKDEIIPFSHDANRAYGYYAEQVTKENAERFFMEGTGDSYDDYAYGYCFMTFLMDSYGKNIFKKILDEAILVVAKDWNEIDTEASAVCLKKCTSEDVFTEFAEWLEENKDRFKTSE